MRKFKYLLALAAVLVGIGSGIGAAPAAASVSCTTSQSPTYWNGYLNFDTHTHCVGASQIQVARNYGGMFSGWYDRTVGSIFIATSFGTDIYTFLGQSGITDAYLTFSHPSWCGGAVHTVATEYWYRAYNYVQPGSWGPWHNPYSGNYGINC